MKPPLGRSVCSAKGCRRVPRQAFDVRNPWPDGKPEDRRHYEVCDAHAAEFFARQMDSDRGGYVERSVAERIQKRLVPR